MRDKPAGIRRVYGSEQFKLTQYWLARSLWARTRSNLRNDRHPAWLLSSLFTAKQPVTGPAHRSCQLSYLGAFASQNPAGKIT